MMREFFKEHNENIAIVVVVALFIGAFFYVQLGTKNERVSRVELYNNGSFAVGTFKGRTYSKVTLKYISFGYDAKESVADYYCYMDSEKASNAFSDRDLADKGDKFLVLYDENDPKNAIIRLDYPIKDNSDFERYVKEFQEK